MNSPHTAPKSRLVIDEFSPELERQLQPILELKNVSRHFSRPLVTAVNRVSLTLSSGETLGLTGDAGSGKSTLARLMAGTLPFSEGDMLYRGDSVSTLPPGPLRAVKLDIQLLFSAPCAALNPRLSIYKAISEAPLLHGMLKPRQIRSYIEDLVWRVGLSQALLRQYPRQLTPAECQRVSLARALAVKPQVLVLDEITAALDEQAGAALLHDLLRLQDDLKLTYVFISRDAEQVAAFSHRVAVMRAGHIVEQRPGGRAREFGTATTLVRNDQPQ